MPSVRVNDTGSFAVLRFEMVGQDADDVPRFVRHSGLAATDRYAEGNDRVPVIDMGPPLHGTESPGLIQVDVIGRAELSDDESRKIENFIARHQSEHRCLELLKRRSLLNSLPQMYCIVPHAAPLVEEDGRYSRMRFSCAGFVFEAYRFARIELVDLSELPEVTWQTIRAAYPDAAAAIERNIIDGGPLGLDGKGPWPVLLCGYLFHALNRDAESIRREPLRPMEGQGVFP